MKQLMAALAFCSAISSVSRAQGADARFDLSCVSSLELPTRGLLATMAEDSGTVSVSIEIGGAGRLSKLNVTGGNPALQGEARVAMNLSRFATACSGRTLEFKFTFKLENPPTDHIIPPGVRFLPPNHFELIFRRLKPILDPASPPPVKQD